MNALSGALRRACLLVSAFAVMLTLCAPPAPAWAADPGATTAPGQYAQVLRSFNPDLSHSQSADIATHVLWLSSYYDLDPRLLVAIVGVESSWHSRAVSGSGAQGLGQLMPATADSLNVLAFDIYENLDGTARYMRRMLQNYAGLSVHDRYARAIASARAAPLARPRVRRAAPFAEAETWS
jgi:soluble lytic murein transglycosylase-like protein